jgi:YVTN family beta-propeller protein
MTTFGGRSPGASDGVVGEPAVDPTGGLPGPACLLQPAGPDYRVVAEVPVGMGPEGVVVDRARQRAYVACSRSNAVAVVDVPDGAATPGSEGAPQPPPRLLPVGREPIALIYDPPTDRLFTADARSNWLTVLDMATATGLGVIPVGSYPAGLGYDPRRRRLYAGNTADGTVTVIDIDDLAVVTTVPAELGAGSIAVDIERGVVYCVNFMSASVSVLDSDGVQLERITVGDGPCKAQVNPVRDVVYVVNSLASTITVLDLATRSPVAELATGRAPVGLTVRLTGDRLYVCNRGTGTVSALGVDGREWARIPVGEAPGDCALDHRDRLLVSNAGTATLTVIEDLADAPPARPAASPRPRLIGQPLPPFRLPDLRTGRLRESLEWAERRYIVDFFASW